MKTLARLIGVTAAAVVLLVGCSSPTDSADPGTEATPPASSGTAGTPADGESTPAEGTTINITLGPDGKVEPNGEKVSAEVGDTITFVINSDHDDEVHIHGIDVEIPVTAGETVTEQVKLETAGSFEVESHHPAKIILILNVR